jgi:dienelactone hydrolase
LLLLGCSAQEQQKIPDLRQALSVPHFRNPLEPRIIERWSHRDITLERVTFQGRYGERIPALLAYSGIGLTRPLPVVLCMPGSPNVKEDLLQRIDIISEWADRGFFTISIDRPHHGERDGNLRAAIEERGLLKVWGESVYDLMRTLDYIETRKEADASRVGMLGLSMGGMEALWLAALDERVDVVVSVAGHLVWRDVFAGGTWKNIFRGMELRHELVRMGATDMEVERAFFAANPGLENVDAQYVVALVAPRPLLLMAGGDDPFIPRVASQHTYAAAKEHYAAFPERVVLREVENAGHSFNQTMQAESLDWFIRWLVDFPQEDAAGAN